MDVIFEPVNDRDITMDDLQDLVAYVRERLPGEAASLNLVPRAAEEYGAGLGWDDIINVVVPVAEYVGSQAGGAVIALTVEHTINWMRKRFSRKHEEHRTRIVIVRSEDGKVLQVFQIESADAPPERRV